MTNEEIKDKIILSIELMWDHKIDSSVIKIDNTKGDWDKAVILYPLAKMLKLPLDEIGNTLGEYILFYFPEISKYEVVKGFLNLKLSDDYLISRLFYVQDYCKELERRLKENIYTQKTKDES